MDLVNVDRFPTLDGKPRNEWYLSRFSEHIPDALNRFHECQQCQAPALPVSPWLLCTGENGISTSAPIYRAEPHIVPRKTLVNVSVYETHFMSVLLYNRDERNALQMQQYSYNREYLARVQELADGEYSFDVQIKGDSVTLGGQKLIPHGGDEITLFVIGLSDESDRESELKRRVFDVVMDGYDFMVVVTDAGAIGKKAMHHLCMLGTARVHVIWRDQDPDNARKVSAVLEACYPKMSNRGRTDLI
ncbi:hypothetical protein KC353_g4131 [Hortaea werneckii]|nr:hypothetical protein KC353_g4131 [Hortaea werneckii]